MDEDCFSGVTLGLDRIVRDVLGDLDGTGEVDRSVLRPTDALLGVVDRCNFLFSFVSYLLFVLIPTDT